MASSEDMVRSVVVQQLGVDPAQVTLTARLVEDLEVSTLVMITIVMQVEELATLTIPDADIQSFKTFGDIVKYVDANTA
jgi:acyl carrier protein